MGQIRFVTPLKNELPVNAVERAYMAGMEGIPWRSRNHWAATHSDGTSEFFIERAVNDSGNLYFPWKVAGRGEVMLSTASLMERPQPYSLPLELARGTVNRLRNQTADWQFMGLQLPLEMVEESRQITNAFGVAATTIGDEVAQAKQASRTIELACTAIDKLASTFSAQAIAARQATTPTLPTFLAVRLDSHPLTATMSAKVAETFNSAMLAFNWRDVEQQAGKFAWEAVDQQLNHCRDQGLRIIGGPLLQLDKHHTPDWLYLWEGDFNQIQTSIAKYVQTVVERYRGKVHVWNCAARMNLDDGSLRLTEEDRLRLVVAVIDEIQRLDPRTPYIISFDQPWAEYLATADHDFSPMHFADSLIRGELGLAGIGLELNFGYWPQSSQPRDLIEISRFLDRWNLLGLPLLVFQATPSGSAVDPLARVQVNEATQAAHPITLETQRAASEQLARLVLAKSFLHGLIWNELSDAVPHEFAHGGVFDAQGRPKPLLGALAELRKAYLT